MENILGIKFKLEDQAKSAYSIAKAKLDEEEEKLVQLEQKKSFYQEKLRGLMRETLQIKEIRRIEDAIEVMKYAIEMQKIAVRDANVKVEIAKKKLKEAMIERKTHEKLRENAFEAFKLEINMQEKKEVDELVSYKYSSTAVSEDV